MGDVQNSRKDSIMVAFLSATRATKYTKAALEKLLSTCDEQNEILIDLLDDYNKMNRSEEEPCCSDEEDDVLYDRTDVQSQCQDWHPEQLGDA